VEKEIEEMIRVTNDDRRNSVQPEINHLQLVGTSEKGVSGVLSQVRTKCVARLASSRKRIVEGQGRVKAFTQHEMGTCSCEKQGKPPLCTTQRKVCRMSVKSAKSIKL